MFKIGDIVCDFDGSTWGKQKFIIDAFFGNTYCPMVSTYKVGHESRGSEVNLLCNNIRLVDAPNRPFRGTNTRVLIKMVTRGIVEAKRELKMRNNTKTIYYGK